jgi:glycosyltransferase involved in cell wall biosynthesis
MHDLTPLLHATGKASTHNRLVYSVKHLAYRHTLQAGLHNAQAIITPTHTVRNDIISVFGSWLEEKIHVTYEGIGSTLLDVQPSNKAPWNKPYFLYVGNFYPHKNVARLIEAFACIKDDAMLVLVGPDDYFAGSVQKVINQHNQSDRIILAHGLSDQELAQAYAHAQALIQPSLAEGFGLQLLEASYFHCPIIASNIPIFQEILGDKYISFDPHDIYDMAAKIAGFLAKPEKKHLSRTHIDKQFSFQNMADETYDIYKHILNTAS